ncbi:hydroxymethylbilane synthase [Kordiimonas aestuarii]|uniref:hydroxymethylbilane synthase n=1 Tax=Kordiimonas aestuarii TaxID=1005925 RepID=UPI0021D3AFCE|nr:hydroxymethylbilane synthase [Kordiimonas aestuarii]
MQQGIKIGTRGSPLALAQANDVKAKLIAAHADLGDGDVEIVVIKTTGDRILDRHLMNAGGKGLFTKEIEDALTAGSIDCAVHSSKDMPTRLPEGLVLSTFLKREDARDVFMSAKYASFSDLPAGATLGTASLRRRAMALRVRPDLKVVTFRGNVQTRMKKLAAGEADGTFLALAGLNRLGMSDAATEILSLADFLPAPAQGAVTVEIREDDTAMAACLAPLHCDETALAVTAEREFLAALDGSCRTPIAAYATRSGNSLMMHAMLLSLDGKTVFDKTGTCAATLEAAATLGQDMGAAIRGDAGEAFFETLATDIEAEIE